MSPDTTIAPGRVLRLFLTYLARYKWSAILSALAIVADQVIQLVGPLYYKKFLNIIATPATGVLDASLGAWHILLIILGINLLQWVVSRIHNLITIWLQPRIMLDIEQDSFHHLLGHSYQFFSDQFSGTLVRRVGKMARAFEDIHDVLQQNFIPLSITLIGILWIVSRQSLLIAGILLVWTLLFLIINYFFARWKLKTDVVRAKQDSHVTGMLADALTNNTNIKLFTGYAYEEHLYHEEHERLRTLRMRGWNQGTISDSLQMLLMIAAEFAVFLFAIRLWGAGRLTLGDFALFQAYLIALFSQLNSSRRVIRRLYESFADASEMIQILDQPHDIRDKKNAKTLSVRKATIDFKDVTFRYQGKRAVLKDMNLSIKSHEKIAIVGPSGAGKSTIIKLLFRFYDIQRGKILIDGQSISDVTQDSLREQIALVPQDPILFHRSLKDNIRYGKRDATDEEIVEAAKKAHCHTFIEQSPEGYDTLVGERGIKLSGGERQRIAIARAILKNAPILVLDEATSSLDSESEALIQDALRELMKNKTAIAIAHRLSTIMQMDRIVVMDQGHVIDSGTHTQLLKKDGIYKKLWEIQAGGFLP